jgi:CDP-glucose 4,6-dehydratase
MDKDYSSPMDFSLGQRLRELPGPLLLTGHTGFKGTWMTFLLEHLNIPVVGYSLPAEKESLYDRADRTGAIPEEFSDIRDYEALERFIDLHKPSTIIHMAAQPLVLKSYECPRETFDINVMGTANLLEIAFKIESVDVVIVVTTDKVYRNDNSGRAFIESDPLEGKDPYSSSKVGTEAVVAAWQQIAKVSGGPKVVSVRAGNVIGGGDFAQDRIIPDLIRALISAKSVGIRNPNSTRPWQHVLDPLLGYLIAADGLHGAKELKCLNFGPTESSFSVEDVVKFGSQIFPSLGKLVYLEDSVYAHREAEKLQINSKLSREELNWKPGWNSKEAIELTFNWWEKYLNKECLAYDLCISDIQRHLATGYELYPLNTEQPYE